MATKKSEVVRAASVVPERPATLRSFGAALRRRREALGLTLDLLADRTGISKPYLSHIETARAPGPPSTEKLLRLANALECKGADLVAAADWLRTPASVRKIFRATGVDEQPRRADGAIDLDQLVGRGTPSARSGPTPESTANRSVGETFPLRQVPMINRVAAGKASEYTDMDYPAGVADAYVPAPDLPGSPVAAAFALRVVGDSMMPEYAEGDLLIVGPGEARDGDDCVVRLGREHDFGTTFKRIYFLKEGTEGQVRAIRLVPLNAAHAERVVPVEEVSGVYPLMYRLTPAKRSGGEPTA